MSPPKNEPFQTEISSSKHWFLGGHGSFPGSTGVDLLCVCVCFLLPWQGRHVAQRLLGLHDDFDGRRWSNNPLSVGGGEDGGLRMYCWNFLRCSLMAGGTYSWRVSLWHKEPWDLCKIDLSRVYFLNPTAGDGDTTLVLGYGRYATLLHPFDLKTYRFGHVHCMATWFARCLQDQMGQMTTPPKFNSSPLKSDPFKRKKSSSNLSFFQGAMLDFGG